MVCPPGPDHLVADGEDTVLNCSGHLVLNVLRNLLDRDRAGEVFLQGLVVARGEHGIVVVLVELERRGVLRLGGDDDRTPACSRRCPGEAD